MEYLRRCTKLKEMMEAPTYEVPKSTTEQLNRPVFELSFSVLVSIIIINCVVFTVENDSLIIVPYVIGNIRVPHLNFFPFLQ